MQHSNPYGKSLERFLTEEQIIDGQEVKVQTKELSQIDATRAFDLVKVEDKGPDVELLRKRAFEAFPKEFKGSRHIEVNQRNIEKIKNILDEVIHDHLESLYIKGELEKIKDIKTRNRVRAQLGRSIINNILGVSLSPQQLMSEKEVDVKKSSKKFNIKGLKSEEKIQKEEKEKKENINGIFYLFDDVSKFLDQDKEELVESIKNLQREYLSLFMRSQMQIHQSEDFTSIEKESIDEAVKDRRPCPYLDYGIEVLLDKEKMKTFRSPHVNRFIGYYGIEEYHQVLVETLAELLKILDEHRDIENRDKFKTICEAKLPEKLYARTIEYYQHLSEMKAKEFNSENRAQKFRLIGTPFTNEKDRNESEKIKGDSKEHRKEKHDKAQKTKPVKDKHVSIKRGRNYMRPTFENDEKALKPRARAATAGQFFDKYPKAEKSTIEDLGSTSDDEKYIERKEDKIKRPGGGGREK